ncbi:MAG: hypothetical protein Q8P20_09980 [bacterium]|nr:hypothetical protein [bacterium]
MDMNNQLKIKFNYKQLSVLYSAMDNQLTAQLFHQIGDRTTIKIRRPIKESMCDIIEISMKDFCIAKFLGF